MNFFQNQKYFTAIIHSYNIITCQYNIPILKEKSSHDNYNDINYMYFDIYN